MAGRGYLSLHGSAIILFAFYILAVLCPNVVSSTSIVESCEGEFSHLASGNVISVGTLVVNESRVFQVEGNITYIGTSFEPSFLLAIDTSDKSAPFEVDRFETPRMITGFAISENCCYVLDLEFGFWILNISEPSGMDIIGYFNTSCYTSTIHAENRIAYLGGWDGLRIVNVSNPALPIEIGYYGPWLEVDDLQVRDGFAYLLHDGGLVIVDVRNPNSPKSCSSFTILGASGRIHLEDNLALLSLDSHGLLILDISDPSNPSQIVDYMWPGFITDLYFEGNLLFVAESLSGVAIFDARNISELHNVGSFTDGFRYAGVCVREGYVYVIDHDHGLWILEHDCDEDGLFSRLEYEIGTPPDDPDADQDSLDDGLEIMMYFTDPLNPDSDSDLMSDGWEVLYGLNPLVNDNQQDNDGDDLSALDEYLAGTSPLTNDTDVDSLSDSAELLIYGTSPINPDSDFDQLPDGWEVQYSLNPLLDDSLADSDMDDLNNLLEYELGTSPVLADSDGDGYLDSWEYYNGFDPLDSSVEPLQYFASILGWLVLIVVAIMGTITIHWISMKYTSSDTYEGYPYDGTCKF